MTQYYIKSVPKVSDGKYAEFKEYVKKFPDRKNVEYAGTFSVCTTTIASWFKKMAKEKSSESCTSKTQAKK